MSQYFHSLGDFFIGVSETALEMRKACNLTPPFQHSLARVASSLSSSDEGSSNFSTSSSSSEPEEVPSGEGLLSGGGKLGPGTGSGSLFSLDHGFSLTILLQ